VVGDTPIALALADLGERVGFDVVLVARSDVAPEVDDAALVVASHGRDEERALERALHTGVPYVGLVASRTRGAAVAGALDVPDELRERLRTPAGLDIGARGPEEVALSILAEIVSLRHRMEVPGAAVAVDPVCGMEVAPQGAVALDHEGMRVFFCSEACRDAFAAAPDRYVAAH
jgi:xanthine dehydrogenase accessory factor